MKKPPFLFVPLLSLFISLLLPYFAIGGSGFRCGGRIIDVGNTQDYVRDNCGEPTSTEERTEMVATRFRSSYPESHEALNYVIRENKIEVWTYNLGSTQFIRYLTFKNRKLIDIQTGGYGN